MSVIFSSLEWQLNLFPCNVKTLVKIFLKSIVVVQNGLTTQILRFDSTSWKSLQLTGTAQIEEECLDLFTNDNTVYAVTSSGSIYQLCCTSVSGSSDVFGFGSSSSENDSYTWLKLQWKLDDVISVTGIKIGFCAISRAGSSFFWTYYTNLETAHSTIKLPSASGSFEWKLTYHSSEELSTNLKECFFGKRSFIVEDVMTVVTPSGRVLLLPIGLQTPIEQDCVTLHWEASCQLIKVLVNSPKHLIILVYSNGKVVCAKAEVGQLSYQTFYLPSSVCDVSYLETKEKLFLVWSDGIKLTAATFDGTHLKILKPEKPLWGLEQLFSLNDSVIAFNTNLCFYRISISSETSSEPLKLSSKEILNEMKEVQSEMDIVNDQILKCDCSLSALSSSQSIIGKLTTKLNEDNVVIENLSSISLSKDVWSFKLDGISENRRFCFVSPLEQDLVEGGNFSVNIPESFETCESTEVSLVGMVAKYGRLLIIPVGKVDFPKRVSVVELLDEKLKEITLEHS